MGILHLSNRHIMKSPRARNIRITSAGKHGVTKQSAFCGKRLSEIPTKRSGTDCFRRGHSIAYKQEHTGRRLF